MSLLWRKVRRDLRRLWSQVLTIALVVGSAVGALLTTQACVHSLEQARADFYREGRMADVFASVRRAPWSARAALEAVPGVAQVQLTLERPLRLLLPDQPDPVMGHAVGIAQGQPLSINRVFLRSGLGGGDAIVEPGRWPGRWPGSVRGAASAGGVADDGASDAAATSEGALPVWISEGFAQARGLQVGSHLRALMNGRLWHLQVTGLALAPDVVFAGGMGMPDPRGYAVLWMDERALAAAWDLQGQWTRLALRLAPGARLEAVLDAVNALLPRWGGREALPLRLQASHQMLDNEIQEQRLLGTILPAVFMGVSIFLLHALLTRLVATQRESIASLMALGFSNRTLAVHLLAMALVIAALGLAVGALLGWAAGSWLVSLYAEFFRFPSLPLRVPLWAWALAVGAAVAAATAGVAQALRSIVRLSPAQAMQPPAPLAHRHGWWERATLHRRIGLVPRMVLRQVSRRPWRALLHVVGVASAMALVVMGHFFRDAIDEIVARQFELGWRGDVQVMTLEPVTLSALRELQQQPGVRAAEGSRTVTATLVHGHRQQRVQLRGWSTAQDRPDAPPAHWQQQRLLDAQAQVVQPRDDGLVLTDRLAHKLGLRVGDEVRLRIPEAPHPEVVLRVSRLMGETMGLSATTTRRTVNRLMQEDELINGLSLQVEPAHIDGLLRATAGMPRVAGTFSKAHLLRNMQAVSARNIRIMSGIMTAFALVVALGVVYNNARIALAERAWELASLRVLGFTEAEVGLMMVGEQVALLLAALPLGMLLGWALVWTLSWGLKSDQFQFPVVVWPRTYAMASLSVGAAAAVSAIVLLQRIHALDMVAALKTRE